ncbi:radical SAM domain-containing protein [Oscillochloris trichoides DG-6]|uniref:Radical SAM domain-containing protein n=1 Tax=Oscillochloris trichoides DG-6 TaxID=765420 RepID=E1IAA1_9CHLR|nr:radical SAM domain-containing protein [Oscillochloris trichoides DG-6]
MPAHSHVAVLNTPAVDLLNRMPQRVDTLSAPEQEAIVAAYEARLLTQPDDAAAIPLPSDTLSAWLHVTNACNLRCTYCYIEKSAAAMSTETGMAAIDAIFRSAVAHNYANVKLKYAGGEAALNLPLVSYLHQYAQAEAAKRGITLSGVLLSNGTVLTRSRLREIRRLGLELMVSLDGMGHLHDQQRPLRNHRGSFATVQAGIARALDEGLDPTISITITAASVAGLPDLLRWLLTQGLRFSLNFSRSTEQSPEALRLDEERIIAGMRAAYAEITAHPPRFSLLGALLDRANLTGPHMRPCSVGESYLVVDHQGGIAKCQMEITNPVASIADPDPLQVVRTDQRGVQNLSVDEKIGCQDCTWRYWCAGGCAIETFRATGRYDRQSPNCAIYRALYPEVLRLEGLRLLHYMEEPSTGEAHANAARSVALGASR